MGLTMGLTPCKWARVQVCKHQSDQSDPAKTNATEKVSMGHHAQELNRDTRAHNQEGNQKWNI